MDDFEMRFDSRWDFVKAATKDFYTTLWNADEAIPLPQRYAWPGRKAFYRTLLIATSPPHPVGISALCAYGLSQLERDGDEYVLREPLGRSLQKHAHIND